MDSQLSNMGANALSKQYEVNPRNNYIVFLFPKLGEKDSETMFFDSIEQAYNYKQEISNPDNFDRIHIARVVKAKVVEY